MHYSNSLDAAQRYVQRGFSVFPVHTLTDGACSCGKSDCGNVAKHPLTENGVDDATNDAANLQSYFDGVYAIANVGVATGDRSGVIVIDVDDEAAIARLESENGSLPTTWTVRTGSGGRHLYFEYEDRFASVKNSVKFCGSLDVRTTGGYVLAPPSLHASGKRYEWLVSPDDCELAALPEWLFRLLPKREPKTQRIERAKTIDERLVAYLDKTPPAIQGAGGDNRTFAVACRIVELFGSDLGDEALLSGLLTWNDRCEPPWDESDLRRKIAEARTKVGSTPNRSTEADDADDALTLHEDAYCGLVGEIVKAVDPETEADSVGVLLSLLVCFGSAIGNVPRFEVGHDSHGGNLFVALVGETASGKGQALNVALRLLRRSDPEWSKVCVAYGLASGEGLVERLSDPFDENADVFAVPPAKRLLCVETEFARPIAAMRRDGSTLSPILRSAWDGQTLEVMTRTKSKLRASNAHVSILAHVTEPELRKLIGGSVETTNGFANRFLWAIVRSTKSLPHGGDPDVLLRYSDRFAEALTKAKAIGRLKRSAEADRLWENVYPTLQRSICKATERGRPIVMRLATLYALTEGNPVIEAEHLRAALAIWRYSEASAIRLFGDDDAGGPETLIAKIRRVVRQRPGLLRSELRNAVSRKVSKADYDAAFKYLVSRGEIVIVQVHEACRPAERFYPGPGQERPYSVTPVRRTESTASNGVMTTCPPPHADEDEPEYVLQNEDGTPFRSEERKPQTQNHFDADEGEMATLGELLTWRNANGVAFARKADGSIWVTDAFASRLTPSIERAIRANQGTLFSFVPFDDFLTLTKPASESRPLSDEEFVAELANS